MSCKECDSESENHLDHINEIVSDVSKIPNLRCSPMMFLKFSGYMEHLDGCLLDRKEMEKHPLYYYLFQKSIKLWREAGCPDIDRPQEIENGQSLGYWFFDGKNLSLFSISNAKLSYGDLHR